MEAVFPAPASALSRGRRARRPGPRPRTAPVTFAEIKEVDEENEGAVSEASLERRRRPDVLEERLGRQFAEFRRRARLSLRELSPPPAVPSPAPTPAPVGLLN